MDAKSLESAAAANALNRKGKLICGLMPSDVGRLIDDLLAANMGGEIDVVQPNEKQRLKHPPEECGLSCQIGRVFLGFGNDLEEFEWENEELERGHAIVAVPARGAEAEAKAREIMREYCSTSIHCHGRWTTKSVA